MVYNPGILHEYNQVPFYYQIGFDFTIVVCKEGHSSNTLRYFYDYEYSTESVDLIKGDVIKIKYFKIKDKKLISSNKIVAIQAKNIFSIKIIKALINKI